MKQIKCKKCIWITLFDYNKFTRDVLDAKIKKDKLVNESSLNEKIKALPRKEKRKTLAIKWALKAEQDKIVVLQTFDSNYFRSKSHFKDDTIQNYLAFQPIHICFKKIGNSERIVVSDILWSWCVLGTFQITFFYTS